MKPNYCARLPPKLTFHVKHKICDKEGRMSMTAIEYERDLWCRACDLMDSINYRQKEPYNAASLLIKEGGEHGLHLSFHYNSHDFVNRIELRDDENHLLCCRYG